MGCLGPVPLGLEEKERALKTAFASVRGPMTSSRFLGVAATLLSLSATAAPAKPKPATAAEAKAYVES